MRGPTSSAKPAEVLARVQVARVLAGVLGGSSLDAALLAHVNPGHPQAGFARALCYASLRHGWSGAALLAALSPRPPKPLIGALLRGALTELRFLATPTHAAVSETVNAAQAIDKNAAGYVNAVLRRFLRERESLELRLREDSEAHHEHPRWLIERLRQDWPEQWESLCAAGNVAAPMWLRVDARRGERAAYAAELLAAGHTSQAPTAPPYALRLDQAVAVELLPGFAEGRVSVQDVAAQRVVEVLDAQAGDRVLDACAAPGGKTAALAERASDLELWAIEKDPARVARLQQTLARCRVSAKVCVADACDTASWWDGRPFQRILIDAPCSGTGVIRRHPDIKHLRRPSDLRALERMQAQLLDALWPLLAPGGRLTYATCSILASENQAQIEAFLQRTPLARAVAPHLPDFGQSAGVGLQNLSGQGGADGFYYACLQHSV